MKSSSILIGKDYLLTVDGRTFPIKIVGYYTYRTKTTRRIGWVCRDEATGVRIKVKSGKALQEKDFAYHKQREYVLD